MSIDTNPDLAAVITQHLQSLGLNKSEARIYLAGLQFDRAVGVSELQAATGMKRPTIYHNLDQLALRGLVGKVSSMGRTTYTFSPPEQLEHSIEHEVRQARAKLQTVAQLSSLLEALPQASSVTNVRHFEGLAGVKTAVDMALFCKDPSWKVIAPVQNVFRQLDKRYAKYYVVTRKRHGITARTLWEMPDPDGRPLTRQEVADRQPRYLPPHLQGTFTATTIIFDNKVVLLTTAPELSAIVIESTEINNLFNALFDGLWHTALPYKP